MQHLVLVMWEFSSSTAHSHIAFSIFSTPSITFFHMGNSGLSELLNFSHCVFVVVLCHIAFDNAPDVFNGSRKTRQWLYLLVVVWIAGGVSDGLCKGLELVVLQLRGPGDAMVHEVILVLLLLELADCSPIEDQ